MKLYVSGPMTNIPAFNFPLFGDVTWDLREQGHEVFSPAEYDAELYPTGPDVPGYADGNVPAWSEAVGFKYHEALAHDFEMVMWADGIVMLPGWERSSGGRAERFVAETTGRAVYLATQCQPLAPGERGVWTIASDIKQRRLSAVAEVDHAVLDPADSTLHLAVPHYLTESESYMDGSRPATASELLGKLGEVRVVDPLTGAAKGVKPQAMHLLPWDALLDVSEHYDQGARKYEARNWEKGYVWSSSFAALMRHIGAWWQGEDNDPDFGHSHLRGVVFHALTLRTYELRGVGTDDRPRAASDDPEFDQLLSMARRRTRRGLGVD